MKSDPKIPRVAYIHAGLHKTGTTSIQAMLGMNEAVLANAGIYIPKTGRTDAAIAGHHNIPWHLTRNKHFREDRGTLPELLEEIQGIDAPTVCVSSEEFGCLGSSASGISELFAGFCAIGYDPRVIIYLRPQADYLESFYAEIAKSWTVSFEQVREAVMLTDVFVDSQFNYHKLITGFEEVFGPERLLIRAYRSADQSERLLQEFLAIVSGDRHTIDFATLRKPERMNQMLNFEEVISARALAHNGGGLFKRESPNAAAGPKFEPLTLLEILQVALHFWPSNDRVRRAYGARIQGASWNILSREIVTTLIRDAEAFARKRRIRQQDPAANR